MLLNVVFLSLFLQSEVWIAESKTSDWFTLETTLEHTRLKRGVIEETNSTTELPCQEVSNCVYGNGTVPNFDEVLSRFSPSEVYEEASVWCSAPSRMEVCWRDDCREIFLRQDIEFRDTVMSQICQDLDSFKEAGACFSGSLGKQFQACHVKARHNLAKHTSTNNPVALMNHFRVCVEETIRAIPEPCQEGTKDFLMRFFDFVNRLNLERMGL